MLEEEVMRFKSVQTMLDAMVLTTQSEGTKHVYLDGLRGFIKYCEVADLDCFVNELKSGKLVPDKVYTTFAAKLTSAGLAPKTVKTWLSAFKRFLVENEIEVKKRHTLKVYEIHESRLPTREQLAELLRISDLRARTAILILLSSGIRIGELRTLKLRNIDLTQNPSPITLRARDTKSRKSRTTFISSEAKASLLAYLNKRRNLNQTIDDNSPVIATDRGTPSSEDNCYSIVHHPMQVISKKDEDGWFTLRPHILRKFFVTQCLLAGVPDAVVDAMVGHQRYLARAYELFEVKHYQEWYKKAMPNLLILEQQTLDKQSIALDLSQRLAEALGVPANEIQKKLNLISDIGEESKERKIGAVMDLVTSQMRALIVKPREVNVADKKMFVKQVCVE